jgi:hypothetical protein
MKPQEILVALKLLSHGRKKWDYQSISKSLKISPSTLHNSIKGLSFAGLYDEDYGSLRLNALEEFLFHGIKYVFPVKPGPVVRGMPTAHSAPVLNNEIINDSNSLYVWPFENGRERGHSIGPLYRTVPLACLNDNVLYGLLALIDVLRIGRAREREKSIKLLKGFFKSYDKLSES